MWPFFFTLSISPPINLVESLVLGWPFLAPTSFKSYINKILAEKLDIFVIVYLNNIFIYTKDLGQAHVNSVWRVLKKLKKHGFFAKLKKCQFHKDKVRFLGYVVSAHEVQIKDEK